MRRLRRIRIADVRSDLADEHVVDHGAVGLVRHFLRCLGVIACAVVVDAPGVRAGVDAEELRQVLVLVVGEGLKSILRLQKDSGSCQNVTSRGPI